MVIQDALQLMVQGLVDHEDMVSIEETTTGAFTSYEILVEPGEARMVIGRGGSMIKRIRLWAYAAATKQGKRIKVTVRERGNGNGETEVTSS